MSEDAPILVYVSIDGQDALAGTMYGSRRHKTESASFAYYPEYLRRPDAYALDPAMPLSQGAFHTAANQKLFGAFRDCSPDRWGRRPGGWAPQALKGR